MEAVLKGLARVAPDGLTGNPVHVLKFGSSVLAGPHDYPVVAEMIGRMVARGCAVVAVVSAMGDTTDSLLAAARSVATALPDRLMGALLATGEEASVALLTLALAGRGVPAVGFNTWRLPIRTRGSLSDADPVAVDATRLRATLASHDAVVFPGFVGVDATGVPSLLGRGGSDLTALFLGDALGAAEVRLVKDVDGIFPVDPHGSRSPVMHPCDGPDARLGDGQTPCSELTWEEARAIGGGVVQSKAIDFAERRKLDFRSSAHSERRPPMWTQPEPCVTSGRAWNRVRCRRSRRARSRSGPSPTAPNPAWTRTPRGAWPSPWGGSGRRPRRTTSRWWSASTTGYGAPPAPASPTPNCVCPNVDRTAGVL